MIPVANQRNVTQSGVMGTASFEISLDDSAHIMTILRDTLYSDKVLAVLREYSSNAWDAHREAGKADVPIEVTLPTAESLELVIRDHGPGLSHESVMNVYTQYGRSTKRDSNEAVGMLGIGSKSAFAYADSFTIVSCHGGHRRTYVAALDQSERGNVSLLHEEPCPPEETGVTITLAVDRNDVEEFKRKAAQLYMFFEPRPQVNVTIPALPEEKLRSEYGVIFEQGDAQLSGGSRLGLRAVMGCVSYRVDLNQVSRYGDGVPSFVHRLDGALFFKIGEVQVNASREELKYGEQTKRAIVGRVNELVDDYVKKMIAAVSDKAVSSWDRRVRMAGLAEMRTFIPTELHPLLSPTVSFPTPNSFRLVWHEYGTKFENVDRISVNPKTRLLVNDANRSLKGYTFGSYDYIVRRHRPDQTSPTPEVSNVETELAATITTLGIEGVPVVRMSTLPWRQTNHRSSANNEKHKLRLFMWDASNNSQYGVPYSDFWTGIDHVPDDDDVYVELSGFKPIGRLEDTNLVTYTRLAEKICGVLGIQMPVIYGYKVTQSEPSKARKGKRLSDWYCGIVEKLVKTASFINYVDAFDWRRAGRGGGYYSGGDIVAGSKKVSELLGADHMISQFVDRYRIASTAAAPKILTDFQWMERILDQLEMDGKRPRSSVHVAREKIESRYPLMKTSRQIFDLFAGTHGDEWKGYVKMIDERNGA